MALSGMTATIDVAVAEMVLSGEPSTMICAPDPNPDPSLPPAQPGDFANPQNALVLGWNQYKIEVQGNVVKVNLNGVDTCRYTNTDASRGQSSQIAGNRRPADGADSTRPSRMRGRRQVGSNART